MSHSITLLPSSPVQGRTLLSLRLSPALLPPPLDVAVAGVPVCAPPGGLPLHTPPHSASVTLTSVTKIGLRKNNVKNMKKYLKNPNTTNYKQNNVKIYTCHAEAPCLRRHCFCPRGHALG